ncbi:protein FAM102A-like [Elysia marginata]|uniref:Protein FAM102A-like n=1 Tax=Elysia marginata TaxID=1093978 RepID=A0AAV4IE58_9GAST|nr:protein FAM102A-like [Elysia marginata]
MLPRTLHDTSLAYIPVKSEFKSRITSSSDPKVGCLPIDHLQIIQQDKCLVGWFTTMGDSVENAICLLRAFSPLLWTNRRESFIFPTDQSAQPSLELTNQDAAAAGEHARQCSTPQHATMIPFMSKKKKFKFQVQLSLEELAAVPYVSGVLFAKVRLNDGGSFTDISPRVEIYNNQVKWHSNFEFPCKMTASMANGVLDPCFVRISVRKELKGGRSQQKLGYVDLNLAQFAGGGRQSKRYLLEAYDTKNRQDNSNIKIGVELSLISGDPVFKVPSNHSVAHNHSAPGQHHIIYSSDPVDLRPCDNHSEDSLASSSSGFSSLTRRGKISDMGDPSDQMSTQTDGLGHSRSASYASQHSRGSGYGSHSRQSSNASACSEKFTPPYTHTR